MRRHSNKSRFLIAVLCVAIVAVRVGGLHAHLCMDGSEPPLTFHVADSGIHHLDEPGAVHIDRDMTIASDLVMKKPFGGFDLLLLGAICALLLFLVVRARNVLAFPPLPVPVRSARTHLRPPLRGPPLLV